MERMTKKPIRIGVLGAGGRMGQSIIAALADWPAPAGQKLLALGGAVERAGHPSCGLPAGPGHHDTLTICSNIGAIAHKCDVLIDFSVPAALAGSIEAAQEGRCALVIGTTGLEPAHHALIDAAARDIAVLQAANTSLGVTLLARLVEQAAHALGPDWDIEIAELHHRLKVDAPSGTALALGEAAAAGRGIDLASHSDRGRDGVTGERVAGQIGFASLRGGSAAGDHMVLLAGEGERIELWHRAEDRSIFARGALKAAQWLAGRKPGRYAMADVLALR
jgi:4-hydroxy-tetrahydrodipicolinate reductase